MEKEGIDFVIMWVDGADENWRRKKLKYQISENLDAREIRYRDWGLLRYWFRGVEAFAPWVRRIYFVSDGQYPSWLNKGNEKLYMVTHEDFIPKKYLPTFSANPIELNLHRIKGLSNQFVLFNDDMYLLKPVKETDFFKDGMPVDDAILNPIICRTENEIGNIIANDMGIINKNFQKNAVMKSEIYKWFNPKYGIKLLRTLCLLPWRHFSGFFNDHIPQPFLKSTFSEVWKYENEYLDATCCHKFRDYQKDVNQWLIRYWQFATNQFFPANPSRGKDLNIITDDVEGIIQKQKFKMICINDSDEIDSFEEIQKRIERAFCSVLPSVSSFELE